MIFLYDHARVLSPSPTGAAGSMPKYDKSNVQATTSECRVMRGSLARVAFQLVGLCLLCASHSYAASLSPTEGALADHPDWLPATEVRKLLTGNTITALNESSSSRWWIHYRDRGYLLWENDFGEQERGLWSVDPDGRYCVAWESGFQQCWRLRYAGEVVRFDNPQTGKAHRAAVLQSGDTQDLAGGMTPEAYAALSAAPTQQATLPPGEGGDAAADDDSAGGLVTFTEAPPSLSLRVLHDDPQEALVLMDGLAGVRLAEANERADLTWDVPRSEIGDADKTLAYLRTNAPSEVQLVVDRRLFVADLETVQNEKPGDLAIRLRPARDAYRAGEQVALDVTGRAFAYNLLFNLGPYGSVDLLYPVESDLSAEGSAWPRVAPTQPFSLSAVAGAPFGANLVIAVSSPEPPAVLLKTLRRGGGPAGLRAYLKAIKDTGGELAIAELFIVR